MKGTERVEPKRRSPLAMVAGAALVLAVVFFVQSRGASDSRPRVRSPAGWCDAYVVRLSETNAQVMLDFDHGSCGSGAVSALGDAPALEIRWLDATTLEVAHAASVAMMRNASGEVIQCGGPDRRVRVVLRAK